MENTNSTSKQSTTKMTREEMIEKLQSLHAGVKIKYKGKIYEVLGAKDCGGKTHRHDIAILEVGKPMYYMVPGLFRAKGTMIEMSNIDYHTIYARKSDMNFEIL